MTRCSRPAIVGDEIRNVQRRAVGNGSTTKDEPLRQPRRGASLVTIVIEVLLVAITFGSMILALPMILNSRMVNLIPPVTSVPQIFQIEDTSNGRELWVQTGISEIRAIDFATGKQRRVFQATDEMRVRFRVSQDASTYLLSLQDREFAIIRNAETVVLEDRFDTSPRTTALSRDGSTAIIILQNRTAHRWDLSGTEPIHSEFELVESTDRISIDSRGVQLAAATTDGEIHIYDLKSGEFRQRLVGTNPICGAPEFSADGRWLSVCRRRSLELFHLSSGDVVWKHPVQSPNDISIACFSPDGNWIGAPATAEGVHIIDRRTGDLKFLLRSDSHMDKIAFSSSNNTIYTACADGSIRVWSLSTGREIERIELSKESS